MFSCKDVAIEVWALLLSNIEEETVGSLVATVPEAILETIMLVFGK